MSQLKEYDIWAEGFVITGQTSQAFKLTEKDGFNRPVLAESFNDAVRKFRKENPTSSVYIREYNPENFTSRKAYENRRSNWAYWGCALFDNEADARKSFG